MGWRPVGMNWSKGQGFNTHLKVEKPVPGKAGGMWFSVSWEKAAFVLTIYNLNLNILYNSVTVDPGHLMAHSWLWLTLPQASQKPDGLSLFSEESGTELLYHCPLLLTECVNLSCLQHQHRFWWMNTQEEICAILMSREGVWFCPFWWPLIELWDLVDACVLECSVCLQAIIACDKQAHTFFIFLWIWISSVLCVIPVVRLFWYYLIVIVLWSWILNFGISVRNNRNRSPQKGWDSEYGFKSWSSAPNSDILREVDFGEMLLGSSSQC